MQSTCQQTCQHTCGNTCGSTCDTQTCQSTCSEGCGDPCEECEDPEGIIYLKVDQEYEFESPCPDGGTTTWEAPGGEPNFGDGQFFITKFPTPGEKIVTVEWEEDDCSDDTEFHITVNETDEDKWTVMIYICADDNKSEGEFITCFKSMAAAGSNEEVNFVAQMDRYSGGDTSYGDWTDVRRGLINKSDVPSDGTDGNPAWGESIGEQDMAHPGTLVNFVNWGITTYPAEHYTLFFLGHGSGWYGGFWDYDPHNNGCLLYTSPSPRD